MKKINIQYTNYNIHHYVFFLLVCITLSQYVNERFLIVYRIL